MQNPNLESKYGDTISKNGKKCNTLQSYLTWYRIVSCDTWTVYTIYKMFERCTYTLKIVYDAEFDAESDSAKKNRWRHCI